MKKKDYAEYYARYADQLIDGIELYESETADFSLPYRNQNTHKYNYGRALIIAGSTGFSGAPVLAANACERSGAGLTTLLVPDSIYQIAAVKCDGAVVRPLPAAGGTVSATAVEYALAELKKATSCVIGPGLGTASPSAAVLRAVISSAECPLVIDADALTICGEYPELLRTARVPVIITPHTGEFGRIGGDLSRGRLRGAYSFLQDHPDIILLLKEHGTLICGNGKYTVNPTGSAAIAKGGSGDVLCGILSALLAQGIEPYEAACCASYVHGYAGDLACEKLGEYSVTPSDIIREIPRAFLHIHPRKTAN